MPVRSAAQLQAQALAQVQPKARSESMKRMHQMQIRRARTRTRATSGAEIRSEPEIEPKAAQLADINMKPASDSRLEATITRTSRHSSGQTTCSISRFHHNRPSRRHRLQMTAPEHHELLARPTLISSAINTTCTTSTTNHLFLLLLSSSLLFLSLSLLSTLPIPASSMNLNNNNNNQAGEHQLAGQMFTCGKLYYRTFHMDQQRNVLYIGAM